MFTSMFLCVWVRVPQHTYGGQRTVCRHQVSLSATWVLELKLRWASLSASTFTHWATSAYSFNFSSDMYVHAVAHMHMRLLSYVLSLMHTCLFPYVLLFMHAVAHMHTCWLSCALSLEHTVAHIYFCLFPCVRSHIRWQHACSICTLIHACFDTHAHMFALMCTSLVLTVVHIHICLLPYTLSLVHAVVHMHTCLLPCVLSLTQSVHTCLLPRVLSLM